MKIGGACQFYFDSSACLKIDFAQSSHILSSVLDSLLLIAMQRAGVDMLLVTSKRQVSLSVYTIEFVSTLFAIADIITILKLQDDSDRN